MVMNFDVILFVTVFSFVIGGIVGNKIETSSQYERCLDRNSTLIHSAAIHKCNIEIKGDRP